MVNFLVFPCGTIVLKTVQTITEQKVIRDTTAEVAIECVLIPGSNVSTVSHMSLDGATGLLYFSDVDTGFIGEMITYGSFIGHVRVILNDSSVQPTALAVDSCKRCYFFWQHIVSAVKSSTNISGLEFCK